MKKIKEFLIENGYELFDDGDVIDGQNEYLRIMVIKTVDEFNEEYIIRNAIRCYFDRWANSGVEIFAHSEDEVINYFKNKHLCITDAVSGLVEEIIRNAEVDNDNSKIETMINMLYEMV